MIEVWSWPTPNGHKVHIALEELGLEYKVIPVNIGAGRVPQDRSGRFSTDPGLDPGAISARSGRWWRRWRRCMCKGFRPAK